MMIHRQKTLDREKETVNAVKSNPNYCKASKVAFRQTKHWWVH